MLRHQFVKIVSDMASVPPAQVKQVFEAMQTVAINELVLNGEVRIPGIAYFKVLPRKSQPGRNPRTGVPCVIAPGFSVRAKPVSGLLGVVVNALK